MEGHWGRYSTNFPDLPPTQAHVGEINESDVHISLVPRPLPDFISHAQTWRKNWKKARVRHGAEMVDLVNTLKQITTQVNLWLSLKNCMKICKRLPKTRTVLKWNWTSKNKSVNELLSKMQGKDETYNQLLQAILEKKRNKIKRLKEELQKKECELKSALQEIQTKQEELSQARRELKKQHEEVIHLQREKGELSLYYNIEKGASQQDCAASCLW